MPANNGLYENAPLVEAVFEMRFLGEPAVECNRHLFYEQIRDVYPSVLVPKSDAGKAMALEPYKFEREDRAGAVMLALNKLAVSCTKYEGFRSFREEVLRICGVFGELFEVEKLNRVGLRYINVIPFARENGIVPIRSYLNMEIALPEPMTTDFKNLSIVLVSRTEGGTITSRIEPARSKDKTQEVIILDFDYAKDENVVFSAVSGYLDESHQHTKQLFEGLITEDYRMAMRGEAI